jgi:hypothetical protein
MTKLINIKNDLRFILNIIDRLEIDIHYEKNNLEQKLECLIIQHIESTTIKIENSKEKNEFFISKNPKINFALFNDNENRILKKIEDKKISNKKTIDILNLEKIKSILKYYENKIETSFFYKNIHYINSYLFKINLHSFEYHSFLLTKKKYDNLFKTTYCSGIDFGFFVRHHSKPIAYSDFSKKELIKSDLINVDLFLSNDIEKTKKEINIKKEQLINIENILKNFNYEPKTDYYILKSLKTTFIDAFNKIEPNYSTIIKNKNLIEIINKLVHTSKKTLQLTNETELESNILEALIIQSDRFFEHSYLNIITVLLQSSTFNKDIVKKLKNKELVEFLTTHIILRDF